jgi:hypothetical protein
MSDPTILPAEPAPIEVAAAATVAAEKAARLAAEARATTAEQQLAAAIAKPFVQVVAPAATTSAPDPLLEEFRLQQVENRNERRIAHVKQIGFVGALDDEQLLKLIPDVDPRQPAGRAAFETWRAANGRLFSSPGQTLESVVAAMKPAVDQAAVKSGGMFKTSDVIDSLFKKRGQ